MPVQLQRGRSDAVIDQLIEALNEYVAVHPRAKIALYRLNPVSVRIRVVDPDLQGLDTGERSDAVWKHLSQLPDEVVSDVSMLVLLTPGEARKSMANLEFEDPVSSPIS